jgi:hypothetical protein
VRLTPSAVHPKRLRIFRCENFDVFMARMHESLGLPDPMMIAEPLKAARTSYDRLLAQTTPLQQSNTMIRGHAERLAEQLRGSIARVSEAAALDLFDAQIALGSRDHAGALARVERYSADHPGEANPHAIGPHAVLAQVYAKRQRWPQLNMTMQRIAQIDLARCRFEQHHLSGSLPVTAESKVHRLVRRWDVERPAW